MFSTTRHQRPARVAGCAIRAVALACILSPATAFATDGSFQDGIGARDKSLAGAGVANDTDATAISLNPAGLVHAGTQVDVSTSLIHVQRGFDSTGSAGVTAPGDHTSGNDWFALPNLAVSKAVDWGFTDAVGFSVYANGGINTDYANTANSNCPALSGINCGGKFGLDLEQTFISVALAKSLAPGLSVGVAPILARQAFQIKGVSLFAPFSVDPANFSDHPADITWGFGVRGGLEWTIVPGVRFGVAGTDRIHMGRNDLYAGVLAGGGSLDIPASAQAGIAVDVSRGLTLMLDAKRIWYSAVAALGNPSNSPTFYGAPDGPGFGIKDVTLIKFGGEWRARPDLTVRAGYSFGTDAVTSRDADLNTLSGGGVRNHFATGLTYNLTKNFDLELAGMFAPRTTVSGPELLNANRNVELNMSQYELTVGGVYRFDTLAPIAPLK